MSSPGGPVREPSVHYPDRLRGTDDAHQDVTATNGTAAHFLNQSVFSMIAAAGSKVDFHARFDETSSDSDPEDKDPLARARRGEDGGESGRPQHTPGRGSHKHMSQSVQIGRFDKADRGRSRALRKLNLSRITERSDMSGGMILPSPPLSPTSPTSPRGTNATAHRGAPIMSQMVEAQTKADSTTDAAIPQVTSIEQASSEDADSEPRTSLRGHLKDIFGFETEEEVNAEYPCWLLQIVLLQGYMYITERHVCFYAYLPKKSNLVIKSGHLSKKNRSSAHMKRFWFALKGDVLSYYRDQSDLYFPNGNIDLRYAISASMSLGKGDGKESKDFELLTDRRLYHFKADNHSSAKDWVKMLQKVIFRSQNDGDSVKISLPISNIIDIEENPVLDFADTFKIRVFENDDTYAIDEYFFSFFTSGKEAHGVLRSLIDSGSGKPSSGDSASPVVEKDGLNALHSLTNASLSRGRSHSPHGTHTPRLRDQVRATLVPSSRSPSCEHNQRDSFDRGRRSLDLKRRSLDVGNRDFSRSSFDRSRSMTSNAGRRQRHQIEHPPGSPSHHQSITSDDAFLQSLDSTIEDSHLSDSEISATEEAAVSGSQILQRSDVFMPTRDRQKDEPSQPKPPTERLRSDDSVSTASLAANITVQPPTREPTREIEPETESSKDLIRPPNLQSPSPKLQQLVRAGGYPFHKAAGLAGFFRTKSKRMSHTLASESMTYVEKVSGMWAGEHRHYGQRDFMNDGEAIDEDEEAKIEAKHQENFVFHFALAPTEKLQASYFGFLHRVLPLYGKIYISNEKFCFRSLLPGTKTKLVLPLQDVENANKEKGFRFGYSGLVIVVRGHEELFFEFAQREIRDDCAVTVLSKLESLRIVQEAGVQLDHEIEEAKAAQTEHQILQAARRDDAAKSSPRLKSADGMSSLQESSVVPFDDPRVSILNFKPNESMRITCLTIGSRGDVQPYIALCKRLLEEGHKPKIATHTEFESWIRKYGIDFAPVDGDPAELMRICVENGMFTYSFLREASQKFRSWIDDLLSSAWKSCQDSDVLIESPSAMGGIHIAEALSIPYFRAFTMPWTRTRAYPHAFIVPERKMGGNYNFMTYIMFDNVFWKAIAGQVNRWRKKELGLPSTNLDKMQPNKIPFLYNFSPAVVVPPLDYSDWIRVTGYWFLDESSDWTPPEDIRNFIAQARKDNKKLVYIGFGSIVVSDPAALTKTVVESVVKADVRAILSKGWSDRLGNQNANEAEVPLPSEILQIKSAPHDWLFKQIDAAVHHGGAGTTGASLRAGLPTIVKPFFGDQYFFGSRIEDLGVGICMKKLNVSVFSRALWEATHSERMIVKARLIGEAIRKEDGVGNAIETIWRNLEYAKTLVKHHKEVSKQGDGPDLGEETWTFIGDENDPDLRRQIYEWEPPHPGDIHALDRYSPLGQRRSLDLGA